jgi:pyruvate dehydrogenase E2 component (dihydrolipoamide acetyltransferase)
VNAVAAPAGRLAVSPYARRLARERGLLLSALRGSGPGGRILAADVMGFVAPAEPVVPESRPKQAPAPVQHIAALATTVALDQAGEILAALGRCESAFDLEDLVALAAGRAFSAVPIEGPTVVALETEGRQIVLRRTDAVLSVLRAERQRASAEGHDDTLEPAAVSLKILRAGAVRPVLVPLLPGRPMRLVAVVDENGLGAECLLVFDVSLVAEDAAADWLAAFSSGLASPLSVLV